MHYGLQPLSFLDPYSGTLTQLFSVAQILVATFIIVRVLNVLISWFGERAKREKRMSEHLLSILKQVIRVIVYVFALFSIMAVFNVDLSGIVVGLGVGGIAIAFGVFSYYKKVMSTVGSVIFKLSPVTALLVVLASYLTLFLFASQ